MNSLILFFTFIVFFAENLFAQDNESDLNATSKLENEVNLPIFDDNKVVLDNQDIQSISLFNVTDLFTLVLFFLFFVIFIFLFKKMILSYKKNKNNDMSSLIRELAFYEIDNKNSIRIVNVLGNVYVFLVSNSSSIVLKEITTSEELENLEFQLNKIKSRGNINSFKSIFNKILRNNKKDKSFINDHDEYAELENDIETSLKSKQDRLKKF
ncbi:Flagellar biosynthetic protein fliZ [Borrelia crocidurae DOU]|uniref:Flagellar biosynthetic protein fliZ n=1 Tax=Borrelia crocidurae DOU TaxID=1293575 RepID=W5SHH0_9SPIR|nr:flagella biosynthesis regulatory protein FliZ [Borrelia crocidurae]AHH06347.1 Flagellar biosynthetic protein fliZ [Borrelia crocidurae DOU]